MYNPIPSKPCIIDNDMDFPTTEVRSLGDEFFDVCVVENVAGDCECPGGSTVVGCVDGGCDGGGFFCLFP